MKPEPQESLNPEDWEEMRELAADVFGTRTAR